MNRGGTGVLNQITAYGGRADPVFQRAISQSAAWFPRNLQEEMANTSSEFLALLNVSSFAEARNASSQDMMVANLKQVLASNYGDFTYGPASDGIFAPHEADLLFTRGNFNHNVSMMVGHNTHEGIAFIPPYASNDESLSAFLRERYPAIQQSVLDYILQDLYPPVLESSDNLPYSNNLTRTAAIVSDASFVCHTNTVAKAFNNGTYNYLFAVPPGIHAQDLSYTFWDRTSDLNSTTFAPDVAMLMHSYITNFVKFGTPNGAGLPLFPLQGMNATILELGVGGAQVSVDDTVGVKCDFWQEALYN
jgi:carboxylesterase type B